MTYLRAEDAAKVIESTRRDRIITRPGKFEGEREVLRDAYDLYLEGCADSDDGETVTVTLEDGTAIAFTEDDRGFVSEVPLS